jgi:sec-independent protein translocase protein TatA
MLRQIGPFELLIVLVIVVLIFGVGRLGELGGALGKTLREFRKEVSAPDEDAEQEKPDEEPKDE